MLELSNLDNLSLDQLKDYADDVEVNAKANLTDVTVEQEQEVEDSKFTFNDIINTPNRPILPSELDFGDNYDHERMRDDDVDGFSGE